MGTHPSKVTFSTNARQTGSTHPASQYSAKGGSSGTNNQSRSGGSERGGSTHPAKGEQGATNTDSRGTNNQSK